MRIVNPKVYDDLRAGVGLRLNLGCGMRTREGYYGVDCVEMPHVDIIANLNEALTLLPDDSVSAIFTRHTLEHVVELMPLLKELHRVTRVNGEIEVIVPHFSNPYYYSDPTHVRPFGLYTFYYFADEADQPRRKVPNFYTADRFHVDQVQFKLLRSSWLSSWILSPFNRVLNQRVEWLDWYERAMCRFCPVESVRYRLTPKKTPAVTAVAA